MTTHQEDDVLERLNEQDGPRGFFLEVVTILEEAVDSLMRRAFRQEEYAVKYAIEPLLNQSGPLGQLEVRLKLIFALGLISLEHYQDLEAYLKIRDFLVRDPKDYRFSDKPIRDLLHWSAGQEFVFIPKGKGVLLMPVPSFDELAGIAKGARTEGWRDREDRF